MVQAEASHACYGRKAAGGILIARYVHLGTIGVVAKWKGGCQIARERCKQATLCENVPGITTRCSGECTQSQYLNDHGMRHQVT